MSSGASNKSANYSSDNSSSKNADGAAECADGCADLSPDNSAAVTACSAGSAHHAGSCYLFALSHLRVVVGVRLVTVIGADDSVEDRAGAARELAARSQGVGGLDRSAAALDGVHPPGLSSS